MGTFGLVVFATLEIVLFIWIFGLDRAWETLHQGADLRIIAIVISRPLSLRVAAVAFTLLLLLHMDFWRPQRPHLWFGWLPEELAFRIGTIVLAWLLMLWICSRVWLEEEE